MSPFERRTAEGLTKREIIRCIKGYIAREVIHTLAPANRIEVVQAA